MLSTSLQTLAIEIPNPVDDPLSTVPVVRLIESVKSGVHEATLDEPTAGIIERPDTDTTARVTRKRDDILGRLMFRSS